MKIERIQNKRIVGYKRLKEKALSIANELKIQGFIVSDMWIYNFCRRHNLSSRRITHVGQQDNSSPLKKQKIAIDHLHQFEVLTGDLSESFIFNETLVYIDMMETSTLSFKGEKTTEATNTGHDKSRFTVVVCVSVSGTLLKSMVILKGLMKIPKIKVPPQIILKVSNGGSMK